MVLEKIVKRLGNWKKKQDVKNSDRLRGIQEENTIFYYNDTFFQDEAPSEGEIAGYVAESTGKSGMKVLMKPSASATRTLLLRKPKVVVVSGVGSAQSLDTLEGISLICEARSTPLLSYEQTIGRTRSLESSYLRLWKTPEWKAVKEADERVVQELDKLDFLISGGTRLWSGRMEDEIAKYETMRLDLNKQGRDFVEAVMTYNKLLAEVLGAGVKLPRPRYALGSISARGKGEKFAEKHPITDFADINPGDFTSIISAGQLNYITNNGREFISTNEFPYFRTEKGKIRCGVCNDSVDNSTDENNRIPFEPETWNVIGVSPMPNMHGYCGSEECKDVAVGAYVRMIHRQHERNLYSMELSRLLFADATGDKKYLDDEVDPTERVISALGAKVKQIFGRELSDD